MPRTAIYGRVLLKMSGEALMGNTGYGIDWPTVNRLAGEVQAVQESGVQVCLVIGGGNIFRGGPASGQGIERASADYMGMLATVINALAMQHALDERDVQARVLSAIPMSTVCEPYIRRRAVRHLEKGRVVIFAAGTGNPYFTTDTAAALRAAEMGCDALLKGTQVDGVYAADPRTHPDAQRYETLTYLEVLARDLRVMDASAITLARDNDIPILVFSIHEPGAFTDVVQGAGLKTIICDDAAGAAMVGEERVSDDPDVDDLQRRMTGAVEILRQEFSGLRAGRASASLLDHVKVDAYGTESPLNQVSTINVPEPRLITVQVWDKGLLKAIEKAIRDSGLGLNPASDGQLIRVPIPELTEERRGELAKVAGRYAEQARVAVRNVRRDGMETLKKMEKAGEMSKDDHKIWGDEIQKMTDETIKRIDGTFSDKQKEILQV